MTKPKLRWRSLRTWGLLLLLCVDVHHAGCDQSSQYECEEAAAYLKKCCGPGARLPVCNYVNEKTTSGGCGGNVHTDITHIEPDLHGPLANCLHQASCEALQSSGSCGVTQWLNPEQCTTVVDHFTCPNYGLDDNPGSHMCTSTTVTCVSSGGYCPSGRPATTCAALGQLSCQ